MVGPISRKAFEGVGEEGPEEVGTEHDREKLPKAFRVKAVYNATDLIIMRVSFVHHLNSNRFISTFQLLSCFFLLRGFLRPRNQYDRGANQHRPASSQDLHHEGDSVSYFRIEVRNLVSLHRWLCVIRINYKR